jgi:glyoxylase-like metal-dependent hydrolase (beta-lactamase superfamily II)
VLHLPGHTAGLIGLHAPAHKLLFSADHLLQAISPNPFLELGEGGEERKPHSLELYIQSAKRVEALDLDWILPGHGKPFTDHRAVLASLGRFYARRQAKLTEALRREPKSAYELVRSELGRGRRLQLFLMLSEIIGNLEVLESSGAIERSETEELVRFRAR